jgi:hypothetical protein
MVELLSHVLMIKPKTKRNNIKDTRLEDTNISSKTPDTKEKQGETHALDPTPRTKEVREIFKCFG